MLIDLMTKSEVKTIPFETDYNRWVSRMTSAEIEAIKDVLNAKIDGDEIHTAGWMPGRDWTGTVYAPIYDKAARQSYDASAKCFGLMVWVVFMERPETWSSGRFELNGRDIGSRTYFRVHR